MLSNSDHFAIAIGIGDYPGIRRLASASTDAMAFVKWLGAADGGGVPAQNIQALVSPDATSPDPSMARPRQHEIWRAFEYLGLRSGQHIGRRLYLFVRGFAAGQGHDLSVLTAEAKLDRLTGFSLPGIVDWLRQGGLFDEIIVLAELDPVSGETRPMSVPFQATTSSPRPPDVLQILALPRQRAFERHEDAQRLSLVEMWLEAANGRAADPQGRVTGRSIADYVRQDSMSARFPEKLNLDITMTGANDIAFGQHALKSQPGRLSIELPHWMSTLRITNSLFQPVAIPTPEKTNAPSDQVSFEVELPPGIYQIEATLEGSIERKTIIVAPGAQAQIRAKAWKGLKAVSAAPLIGTATAKSQHIERAEEWSRRVTWQRQSGAQSGLFIFVRTLDTSPHPDFARGLQLFDGHGVLVTDFSNSAKIDRSRGFMAFNARLEPGSYVLRRESRSGVRLRQQPLFLHREWETHVFIAARGRPSLRSMTMHMAPLGDGFNHRDATAVASEAVLDVLRHDASPEILQRDQIAQLLLHEHTNPWLGILSAYVLQKELRDLAGAEPARRNELSSQIESIIKSLGWRIGDHPDARALALDGDRPADKPFWHPPILRQGLRLVREHGTRHRGTIPLDSLTDCILGNLVTNAPWTAWRTLDRNPRYPDQTSESPSVPRKRVRRHQPSPPDVLIAGLTEALSPAAPIYPLKARNLSETTASKDAPVTEVDALREAALIGRARALMDKVDRDAGPGTETIDASQLLAGVSAEQLSSATGASIERAETGLERLRTASTAVASNTSAVAPAPASPVVEQAALVAAARAAAGPIGPFVGIAPEADAAEDAADTTRDAGRRPLSVTIEDVGSELRSAATRLTNVPDPAHQNEVSHLSARLQAVADRLLQAARFVIVADKNDHFRFCNGATTALVATGIPAETRSSVLEAWQSSLSAAPLGRSELASPIPIPAALPGDTTQGAPVSSAMQQEWIVDRTQVKDSVSDAVQGYVNILRLKNALTLLPQTLVEIDSMRSDLALYSSLYVHGSQSRDKYLHSIDDLTTSIEHLLDPIIA